MGTETLLIENIENTENLDSVQIRYLLAAFRQSQQQLAEREYTDIAVAQLTEVMWLRENMTLNSWAKQVLTGICTTVEALYGAIYMVSSQLEQEPDLMLIGSYAAGKIKKRVAWGEGLIGEVARSRNTVFLESLSENQLPNVSVAAETKPESILLLPLVHNTMLEGVLEIGVINTFEIKHRKLLERLSGTIAANLFSVRTQEQIQFLYQEAQAKAEALSLQEEKLRKNVAELETIQQELLAATHKLEQKEANLSSLINNSTDLILAIDRNYKITVLNEAVRRMGILRRGLPIETGESIFALLEPDEIQDWQELINRALAGEQFRFDRIERNPEGNRFFEIAFNPIPGSEGIAGVAIFSKDVTQRVLQQRQIEAINTNLEKIVSERTEELQKTLEDLQAAQEHIIMSEKMAALGQLVASVAHEINSPLGAIRASASNMNDVMLPALAQLKQLMVTLPPETVTILDQCLNTLLATSRKEPAQMTSKEERQLRKQYITFLEEQGIAEAQDYAYKLIEIGLRDEIKTYLPLLTCPQANEIVLLIYRLGQFQVNLENIISACDRTKKIVYALKSYSYTQEHNQPAPTNLKNNIETVLTLYHNQFKYGIDLEVQLEDVPIISVYPDELAQVWSNLITNALQAMNMQGKLIITLSTVENEELIRVTITDSGPGISAELAAKIFQPFFTTKKRGEGTGLGLDICRKIVEKHAGKLYFDSEPGRTTFYVDLPIKSTTN
jgi:PAS domain S-box-containing protein